MYWQPPPSTEYVALNFRIVNCRHMTSRFSKMLSLYVDCARTHFSGVAVGTSPCLTVVAVVVLV